MPYQNLYLQKDNLDDDDEDEDEEDEEIDTEYHTPNTVCAIAADN